MAKKVGRETELRCGVSCGQPAKKKGNRVLDRLPKEEFWLMVGVTRLELVTSTM